MHVFFGARKKRDAMRLWLVLFGLKVAFSCVNVTVEMSTGTVGSTANKWRLRDESGAVAASVTLDAPADNGLYTRIVCVEEGLYALTVGSGSYDSELSWSACGLTHRKSPFAGRVNVTILGCSDVFQDAKARGVDVKASDRGKIGYSADASYYSMGSSSATIAELKLGVEYRERAIVVRAEVRAVNQDDVDGAVFDDDADTTLKSAPGFTVGNLTQIVNASAVFEYAVVDVVKSDEYGDGWSGSELQIDGYYSGTLSGEFAVDAVVLPTERCYSLDVIAGELWSQEVSWAVCDLAGLAPTRDVHFCVDAQGFCSNEEMNSTRMVTGSSPVPFIFNSSHASSLECGGPFSNSLVFLRQGVTVSAAANDDSVLVGSSIDAKSNGFDVVFEWMSKAAASCEDGPDAFSRISIRLDREYSTLFSFEVSNEVSITRGDVARAVGYRIVSALNATTAVVVTDGDRDTSVMHYALPADRHRSKLENVTSFLVDNNGEILVNGKPARDAIVDCAGTNSLEVAFGAPGVRAALELCGSWVVLDPSWSCFDVQTRGWIGVEHEISDKDMTPSNEWDDELSVRCAAFYLSIGEDERAVCRNLFDAARTESAKLGGFGTASFAAWIDDQLVVRRLLEDDEAEDTTKTALGSILVDCSKASFELAFEILGPGTFSPRLQDLCGTKNVLLKCAHDDNSTDWRSSDKPLRNWDEVGEGDDILVHGPARCRGSVIPTNRRQCNNVLESCVDLIKFATDKHINQAEAGVEICATTLQEKSDCEATCQFCDDGPQDLVVSLDTDMPECSVHTLELRDSFGDGWNEAEFFVTGIGSSMMWEDTIRISGTLEEGRSKLVDLCLPAGCYSYRVSRGLFESEVEWSFCDVDGIANEHIDVCVEGSECHLLLDFDYDRMTTSFVETYKQPIVASDKCFSMFGVEAFFELPRVTIQQQGEEELFAIAAVFLNRATSESSRVSAGDAVAIRASTKRSTHTAMSVDWTVADQSCEDKNNSVVVSTNLDWTIEIGDEVVRVNASKLESSIEDDEDFPPSLGFGYQVTGYPATISYSGKTTETSAASFHYRIFRGADNNGWSVVDSSPGDVADRVRYVFLDLVLADGSYIITVDKDGSPLICDDVIVAAGEQANVTISEGRCRIAADSVDSDSRSSTLAARTHVVTTYSSASTAACVDFANPSVLVSVTSPNTEHRCETRLSGGYDGQGRIVGSSSHGPSFSVEWEDATKMLCQSETRCDLTWTAEYAYPSLRVAVDAESTDARAGYEISGAYGLQTSPSSSWREEFYVDCTDPLAVQSASTSAKMRGPESVELWVNGIFVVVGFGWETLFKQHELPVRCEEDVIAIRATASTIVGFRATFSLCSSTVDTTKEWRCRRIYGDDLSWTLRGYDDSDWPEAFVVDRVDRFELPSLESQWIWTSSSDDKVVACRYVVVEATTTPVVSHREDTESEGDGQENLRAAYKMVGIILCVGLILFLAFLGRKTWSRYLEENRRRQWRIRLGGGGEGGLGAAGCPETRSEQLNEIMLPTFSPLVEEEQKAESEEQRPRRNMSLGERIAMLHRPDVEIDGFQPLSGEAAE